MVDKRYTASDELNSYYYFQPPNERSSSNRRGIHIDGMMMPKRDIDDTQTGGDSWKVLRGEDLAFAYEAALERSYAAHQFDGKYTNREQHVDEPYPTSRPIARQQYGVIASAPWQAAVQLVHESFNEDFINISAASQLPDMCTKWPDGNDIEWLVKTSDDPSTYEMSWLHPYWALGGFMPPMTAGDPPKSSMNDFARGMPLVGDNVRKVFYDLAKLRFYTLDCPTIDYTQDTTYGYNEVINARSWTTTAHDEEHLDPFIPSHLPGSKYIIYEENSYFDTDPIQKKWAKHECSSGTFRMPYCGKYGRSQGYTNAIHGTEVACYAAFYLQWRNEATGWETLGRVAFCKVPFTRRTDVGAVDVGTSNIVAAAKQFADHYNARIPEAFPTGVDELNFCSVELVHLYTVCQLTSRTDISTLAWSWQPS